MQPGTMTFKILEKIGQVARGEIDASELPGSTTERMAIGLALNALHQTNESYAGQEEDAWFYLDRAQRDVVKAINPEYRKSKWDKIRLPN